ncbi:hypothetical protein Drose_25730 [Dactylosporangium roseum]|uniref:Uncharacterized protein n=1 Tax=Dactylosporangium roseum TaxID=47989 RepID=A0ABY5YZ01_9ACTN|nr:hypothetical protein [Dactylosporangium roseum]UWZ34609.1 hypothetical protein Drose_25730 [Dactylosporangium roseum]
MDGEADTHSAAPVARSAWECQLFLTLADCPACGGVGLSMTEFTAGREILTYTARCATCAQPRTFRFRPSDEPEPVYPAFGGAGPSQIIDAGQFLDIAERSADLVPADPAEFDEAHVAVDPPMTLDDAYEQLTIAVAAVEEALKFVPAGAARIPRSALWAASSLARYDQEPEIFERDVLDAVLAELAQAQSAYRPVAG